jgi:hypothetical protein
VVQIDEMSVKIHVGENDITVKRDKGSLEILPAEKETNSQTRRQVTRQEIKNNGISR